MPTYRAKCWLGSSSGYQNLEVQSNTPHGAKEQFERIYGAEQIINLREVRGSGGGSGVDFDGDSGVFGAIALIGLFGVGWLFITFTPWVLMGIGGASGCWITEKVTGLHIGDYNENSKDKSHHTKAAMILALTLIAGGFGFVKGNQLQQEWEAEENTAKIVNIRKVG